VYIQLAYSVLVLSTADSLSEVLLCAATLTPYDVPFM
jgi:hypothetical protein